MDESSSTSEELNETSAALVDQPPESKLTLLGRYMLETLKEMFRTLRHPEFKFAISGIVITIILILVSMLLFLLPGIEETQEIQLGNFKMSFYWLGIPVSLILAFVVIYFWFLLGFKITPKAAHYLVDNKIVKAVFTRGDVHYLEYIPPEKRKIAMPHIFNKFIALLLAWVSISAFLLNVLAILLADGRPQDILSQEDLFFSILLRLVLFFIVPLIFTLVYPLGWMLMDARLKAYNSGTQLNWLVGKKVANITGGIITIGSLAALGADAISDFTTRAQLMVDLILFCLINVSLTVILVSLFYNVFFQGNFYQMIIDDVGVGFGVTSVSLVDEEGKPLPEEPEEIPIIEPEIPEPESEPEVPEAVPEVVEPEEPELEPETFISEEE